MRLLSLLVLSIVWGCRGPGAPTSESTGETGDPADGAFVTTALSFAAHGPRPEVTVEAVFTNTSATPVSLEPCFRTPAVVVHKRVGPRWTETFPALCHLPQVEITVETGQSLRIERRLAMAPNEAVVPQPLTDYIEGTYRLGLALPDSILWSNAFTVEHDR